MAFNLGYLLAYSVVVALLLMGPLILELRTDDIATVERRHAAVQLLYLHARILPAIALALCVFAVHGIFFSHRIAGPLYRFKQIFRSVRSGDVPSGVHLRQKDFLREEANELGQMLSSLRARLGDIQAYQEKLDGGWERLQRALRSGCAEDIEERLGDVEATVRELGQHIAHFEVGPVAELGDVDDHDLEDPPAPLRSDEKQASAPKT